MRRSLEVGSVTLWAMLNLTIFGPMAIYRGNLEDFGDMVINGQVVGFCLVMVAAVVVGAMLLGIVLPLRIYRAYVVFWLSVAVLIAIQGQMIARAPIFDGQVIDGCTTRDWLEIGMWLFVVCVMQIWQRAIYPYVRWLALVGIALQTLGMGIGIAVAQPTPAVTMARLRADPQTMFRWSPVRNVLVILLDAAQHDIFMEAMRGQEDALDGFTIYDNVLAADTYTKWSVPAMITGQQSPFPVGEYDLQQRYVNEVVPHHNVSTVMQSHGWHTAWAMTMGAVGLQGPDYLDLFEWVSAWRKDFTVTSQAVDATNLANATLVRHVPGCLRRLVFDGERGLADSWFTSGSPLGLRITSDMSVDFLMLFGQYAVADAPMPTLKFMHVGVTHPPLNVNEQCDPQRLDPALRISNVQASTCAMRLVAHILWNLNRIGVYDQTAVMVFGDHGAKVATDSGIRPTGTGIEVGHAWMLMMIKPVNSRGPLRISHAPGQNTDVAATMLDIAGLPAQMPGESILRLSEDVDRIRIGPWDSRVRGHLTDPNSWSKPGLDNRQ